MASVANALTGGMRAVGGVGESVGRHAGAMAQLAWQSLQATVRGQVAFRDFINQAFSMGVQSLPLVLVTATLSPAGATASNNTATTDQNGAATFSSLTNEDRKRRSEYYLCVYELTDLSHRNVLWTDKYEVKKAVVKEFLD